MPEQTWFFTFGFGHKYPNGYIRFTGLYGEARTKMHAHFGNKWAFQYDEEEFPAIAQYWNMKEVVIVDGEDRWKDE